MYNEEKSGKKKGEGEEGIIVYYILLPTRSIKRGLDIRRKDPNFFA